MQSGGGMVISMEATVHVMYGSYVLFDSNQVVDGSGGGLFVETKGSFLVIMNKPPITMHYKDSDENSEAPESDFARMFDTNEQDVYDNNDYVPSLSIPCGKQNTIIIHIL